VLLGTVVLVTAQPAPAIITKPAKPFLLTTFKALKQPQEPNFCDTVPIEDRAIGNTLFNHMLDTQITVTAHKICHHSRSTKELTC
jgi:hypothetical protein